MEEGISEILRLQDPAATWSAGGMSEGARDPPDAVGAVDLPEAQHRLWNLRRDDGIFSSMRKHLIILGLTFAGLAAFAVFAGWAFFAASESGAGWRSLGPIWPYLFGGCAVAATLTALLMWLAFYSANHGYDDRIDPEGH